MPITKSAKKALRSSRAKYARNESLKKNLEINLKKVSLKTLSSVVSVVDKSAKRGLIHKNKAARIKSQLSRKFGVKGVAKRSKAGVVAKTSPLEKPKTKSKPPKKVSKKV